MAKDEVAKSRAAASAAAASAAAAGATAADTADADDTEGHSLGLLMGLNAMSQASDASSRARTRKVPEEELPPLTKKWPAMKNDKKA
jgi:hypothetical protein